MIANLVELTSAFLTVTGLFFAALGAAGTYNEPLKSFLCGSALLMTTIWIWATILLLDPTHSFVQLILSLNFNDINHVLGILLPVLFLIGWSLAFIVHFTRWLTNTTGENRHQ